MFERVHDKSDGERPNKVGEAILLAINIIFFFVFNEKRQYGNDNCWVGDTQIATNGPNYRQGAQDDIGQQEVAWFGMGFFISFLYIIVHFLRLCGSCIHARAVRNCLCKTGGVIGGIGGAVFLYWILWGATVRFGEGGVLCSEQMPNSDSTFMAWYISIVLILFGLSLCVIGIAFASYFMK